jgi:hypothetical protein
MLASAKQWCMVCVTAKRSNYDKNANNEGTVFCLVCVLNKKQLVGHWLTELCSHCAPLHKDRVCKWCYTLAEDTSGTCSACLKLYGKWPGNEWKP